MLKKYISQIIAVGALTACSVFAVGCGEEDLPENPYKGDGGESEEKGSEPEEGGDDDDPKQNEGEGEDSES